MRFRKFKTDTRQGKSTLLYVGPLVFGKHRLAEHYGHDSRFFELTVYPPSTGKAQMHKYGFAIPVSRRSELFLHGTIGNLMNDVYLGFGPRRHSAF